MITALIVISWFLLSYGIVWFLHWADEQPIYSPKTGTLIPMLVIPICYVFGIVGLAALYFIGEVNN